MALVAYSATAAQESTTCADGPHTLYAQHAVPLDSGFQQITSPDGKKTLKVRTVQDPKDPDNSDVLFAVSVGNGEFTTRLAGFNAEVLWSPDSAAFAVTETEGGGGIGYRAYVFFIASDGLRKIDVSEPVEEAFHPPGKCEVAVAPNIVVVDWLHNSQRILIAAEVVPVSVCKCMGAFSAYEVSLPAATLGRVYSMSEAKHEFWSLLGCELRDARSCPGK
jgi:hypothetical protein